eukprot:CAMPEP_0117085776 /NCGR_PEP_ID=MMETSP0472-20121206/60263_1 /TAXON_ID=693140 ORGANISM="Tiarina fusus, Strain LIS" /NCGR_SAMPLE_ID=MMETSP0472 /ASSEMBLY_ACC=CAM_ASM_000603 /LENGTH=924 /DNA_ID=CAMNT_0004815097 /DNA_START=60 /DNA_END=2834 /DNA_ORIENTATION=+
MTRDLEANLSTFNQPGDAQHSKSDVAIEQQAAGSAPGISPKTASLLVLSLLIFVGAVASALFLYIGISQANNEQAAEFERTSNDIVHALDMAVNEYVVAASYIQGASSWHNVTHEEFQMLYFNMGSSGLHVPMVSYNPLVSHMKRATLEESSRAYYEAEYPSIEYHGIQGLEPSPQNHGQGHGGHIIEYRSEQAYYLPSHLIEPVHGNEHLIDLDLYSVPEIQIHIDRVLKTWKPALTSRMGDDHLTYSVILLHPGLPPNEQTGMRELQHAGHGDGQMEAASPGLSAEDFSHGELSSSGESNSYWPGKGEAASFTAIQIQVSDLLSGLIHSLPREAVYVYIYSADDTFLSGAKVSPDTGHIHHRQDTAFTLQQEVSKEKLLREKHHNLKTMKHTFSPLPSDSNLAWTVYVIAAPGTYESETTMIIIGGVMLFALCAILGAYIYGNIRRVDKLNVMEARSQREKAALIVERSAAMSACSFVTAEVLDEERPMIRPERYQSVQEDFEIIDSSLHFINDLLRNMLDMQRAGSKQLKIEKTPTHIMNDILRPVDCMLHRRGSDFKVILECDDNLIVMTDSLRLKQIILNLSRNSIKFVERGFILLKATTVRDEGNNTSSVRLYVEDSGPGIPLEKRKKLFGKFQESLDSMSQGTGIGLSLCKQLINLMGGKLWIDEEYDSGVAGCPGARFVVDLNVAPMEWDDDILKEYESSSSSEDISTAPSTSGDEMYDDIKMDMPKPGEDSKTDSTKTTSCSTLSTAESQSTVSQEDGADLVLPEELSVLFVDDDMVLRKLFSRSVRKVSPKWAIQEAGNGEAALSITKTEKFDVIFMDQYMASVQKQLLGTEATRALRAQGVTAKICGLSANDVGKSFLEAGADSFMMKPFPCRPGALRKELFRVINTGRNTATGDRSPGSTSSVDIWAKEGTT